MSPPRTKGYKLPSFRGGETVEGPFEIGISPPSITEIPIAHNGVIFARDVNRLAGNRDFRRGKGKPRYRLYPSARPVAGGGGGENARR